MFVFSSHLNEKGASKFLIVSEEAADLLITSSSKDRSHCPPKEVCTTTSQKGHSHLAENVSGHASRDLLFAASKEFKKA